MKNNHINTNFLRKVFQDGDSDDELLEVFTTAEFELKFVKDEEEMAFDGGEKMWGDFFFIPITRTAWSDGGFDGSLELN